ncbi:hypothetical protein HDU97_006082 [Phlyctochytrium planicorne]|nr:hypothetical protein HDU97_006082 [Phlyctochytrium planicorne]
MGFHSDDEKELGEDPVIASLSLGATRRFVLKRRGPQNARVRTRFQALELRDWLPPVAAVDEDVKDEEKVESVNSIHNKDVKDRPKLKCTVR